jgi:hypothetical protein
VLPLLAWLVQGAVGPALVGLPVTWAATDMAKASSRWFRRLRRSDGLSRIIQAAVGGDVDLSGAEFAAVRRLLEEEGTWVEVGRGTVESLAARIASCLADPASAGSLAAARAIAGGLLEFAVRDLEPEWFQQVLFARLERMQADQASALDQAMLSVHADLAALLALQDAADAGRSSRVMGQLGQVLDRLPPGPADQGEVALYLATLVRWLNADPWAQDTRLAGPSLTPAAIERKLRVEGARGQYLAADGGRHDLEDADELARQCTRLVVLGGPGSGKTWLAKRTARLCAEAALDALAAGALPEEVELPLYTTCARLAAVPPGDGIRRAIVASAFGQLPDLGGSRVYRALQVLFEERDGPTLLVADSLDEAHGADDRIRQADTLPPAWRIVVTSRPSSWNRQLTIGDDPSQREGVLQPLTYPDDVEAFIAGWFSGQPAWGARLAGQLRDRPAFQQAATVPLILAFYCIVGGGQPLPGSRVALYPKVIRRMLTGLWRGSGDRDPDPEACLEILRGWAWSAAASNPISGVGAWTDEFPTPRIRLSQDDRDALDHVAVPLGPPDADTGMTPRRFVHRSIREHLVAEHIALQMPAQEAADELLGHLWYDPDWENAAPAALAMHPRRDEVLRELICRVTRDGQLHADITAADGCWEIRRFLGRVARESGEDAWPPEAARTIGQARADLAASGQSQLRLAVAGDWPTSNRLIIESLLTLLASQTKPENAPALAEAIAGMDPSEPDRARAQQTLLTLFGNEPLRSDARQLAEAVARLAVTAQDRASARQALLTQLADETNPSAARHLAEAVAALDPTEEDQAQARQALLALLTSQTDPRMALELAEAVAGLDPAQDDGARARQALLTLLTSQTDVSTAVSLAEAVAGLDPAEEDRARAGQALLTLLIGQTDTGTAGYLREAVVRLAVTAQDRASARQVFLTLLTSQTDVSTAESLAAAVGGLDPAEEDRARAGQALLTLLIGQTDPWDARRLGRAVVRLAVTAQDRASARHALLTLLASQTDPQMAVVLAEAVAGLDPAEEDRARARQVLLTLLTGQTDPAKARDLGVAVARLAVTAQDRASARQALLTLLTGQTDPQMAVVLAEAVAGLDPAEEDRARAGQALLALLASEIKPGNAPALAEAVAGLGLDLPAEDRASAQQALLTQLADRSVRVSQAQADAVADRVARLAVTVQDWASARETVLTLLGQLAQQPLVSRHGTENITQRVLALTWLLARLDPAEEDRARAGQALLTMLSNVRIPWSARQLAEAFARFGPAKEDRARAGQALLTLLSNNRLPWDASNLAEAVAVLDLAEEDRARARQALLTMVADETYATGARQLAEAVARLAVTAQDRARVRQALLELLDNQTNPEKARYLAEVVAGLDPSEDDRARVRQALLRLLAGGIHPSASWQLERTIAGLGPTVAELGGSETWPSPPTLELLAAARQNSSLSAWLAALPLLSGPHERN